MGLRLEKNMLRRDKTIALFHTVLTTKHALYTLNICGKSLTWAHMLVATGHSGTTSLINFLVLNTGVNPGCQQLKHIPHAHKQQALEPDQQVNYFSSSLLNVNRVIGYTWP